MIRLLLILIFGTSICFGQRSINKADTSNKYDYRVQFIAGAKKGKLISNKKIGVADTTLAFVTGQIFTGEIIDNQKQTIPFAYVIFTNSMNGNKSSIQANYDGIYKAYLSSGKYGVEYKYVGSPTFNLHNLILKEGQLQKINVCLGDAEIPYTYLVKSPYPLTKKELIKKEKSLKKEFIKRKKQELIKQQETLKHGGVILTDN